MFNKIRYYVAYLLNRKALKLFKMGGYTNIMKGLDYLKYSLVVEPDSEMKNRTLAELERLAKTDITY